MMKKRDAVFGLLRHRPRWSRPSDPAGRRHVAAVLYPCRGVNASHGTSLRKSGEGAPHGEKIFFVWRLNPRRVESFVTVDVGPQ